VEKGETHFYITLKELRELLETAERDRQAFLEPQQNYIIYNAPEGWPNKGRT
jgi:hypothetical protein